MPTSRRHKHARVTANCQCMHSWNDCGCHDAGGPRCVLWCFVPLHLTIPDSFKTLCNLCKQSSRQWARLPLPIFLLNRKSARPTRDLVKGFLQNGARFLKESGIAFPALFYNSEDCISPQPYFITQNHIFLPKLLCCPR